MVVSLLFACFLLLSFPAAPVDDIVLTIDDIITPNTSLKRISARFIPSGAAEISIGEITTLGRTFKNLVIRCNSLSLSSATIRCPQGKLNADGASTDLGFSYVTSTKRLDLFITPSPQERWQMYGEFGGREWQAEVVVTDGQPGRLGSLIPDTYPRPSKGRLTGRIKVNGTGADFSQITGDLRVSELAFSDAAGLHAADKLAGSLTIDGSRTGSVLHLRAKLAWDSGEVFWAPLYFPSGGHNLDVRGSLNGDVLKIEEGAIKLAGVGESRFSLDWNLKDGLSTLDAEGENLEGSGLYTLLLKPFLEKTAFDQLTVNGKLNAGVSYENKAIRRVDLTLADLSLLDARDRFNLEHVNAIVPWRVDKETRASIRFGAAKLLGISVGAFDLPVKMNAFDFNIDAITIPVLDGKLLVNDLHASREKEHWRWQLSGVLLPISMEAMTQSLAVPIMRGILSATIPLVTYENGVVNVGGGIGIRVFDGDVGITGLTLFEPLGRAPRLAADVEMRNLDLGLVTSTFKFGSMEGRIDADVKDLELSNWKPVKLDARVESSPGNYRKKISQQAVQNISALGGAGAAAALQRTFLRFFEEFGYEKIGLSCRLRNNVCEMSGVESTPQGYVIVKGGGIPAITVKGYNRYVGWSELLDRLVRITQSNAQPVIR